MTNWDALVRLTLTNWFDLLQSLGIIAGLFFATHALIANARAQRAANLLTITQHHREIWGQLVDHPELARVLAPGVDLEVNPVTEAERRFVLSLILHLNASYEMMRAGTLVPVENVDRDVCEFFALPIPRRVWVGVREKQNKRFIRFVERAGSEGFISVVRRRVRGLVRWLMVRAPSVLRVRVQGAPTGSSLSASTEVEDPREPIAGPVQQRSMH